MKSIIQQWGSRHLIGIGDLPKCILSDFDPAIADVEIIHGPNRLGDIPHSLASVDKARQLLGYVPTHNIKKGLEEAILGIMTT